MKLRNTLMGACLIGLAACTLEAPAPVESVLQPTVESGMLNFASINAYDQFIGNYQAEDVAALENAPFEPMHEHLASASMEERVLTGFDNGDESLLFTLLNAEGMLTIGNYVVKVDLPRELVAVANAEDTEAVAALATGNSKNAGIRWFSTNDDVLDLLEDNHTGTLGAAEVQGRLATSLKSLYERQVTERTNNVCSFGARTVTSTSTKKTIYEEAICGDYYENCKRWLADTKHTYQKAGVYFSLQSKIKYRGNVACSSNAPYAVSTDLTIEVTYYYEKRVRFGKNQKRSGTHNNETTSNELNYRAYEGSRSLKEWRLDSKFTYKRKDDCSTNHNCIPGSGTVRTITLPRIDS